ncbi:MAG: acyl carrier protein [Steroidobacteraceae bacterium]
MQKDNKSMQTATSDSAIRKIQGAFTGGHDAFRIRQVLQNHGRLSTSAFELAEDADLYEAGMSSLASVNVMLALEGEFNIEFPDQMLNRSVFSSIAAIGAAVKQLNGA